MDVAAILGLQTWTSERFHSMKELKKLIVTKQSMQGLLKATQSLLEELTATYLFPALDTLVLKRPDLKDSVSVQQLVNFLSSRKDAGHPLKQLEIRDESGLSGADRTVLLQLPDIAVRFDYSDPDLTGADYSLASEEEVD